MSVNPVAPKLTRGLNQPSRNRHWAQRTRSRAARPPASGQFLFGDRRVESRSGYSKPGAIAAFTARNHANGTATSIWVYVTAHNRAATLSAALYSVKHGHLGHLLTSGHVSPKADAWNQVGLRPFAVKPGTTYWITLVGRRGNLSYLERKAQACPRARSSSCPMSAYVTGRIILRPTTKGTRAPGGTSTGLSGPANGLSGTGAGLSGPSPGLGTGTSTDPVTPPPLPTLAPLNLAAPQVTGQTVSGGTLSTSNGIWLNGPTSYSYAWEDCNTLGASCSSISGASGSSYTVGTGDVGSTLRVVVTASNGGGSTQATSGSVGPVTGSSQSCAGYAADTPGGADPWGGCFPGPENTGVPAGTALTNIPAQETSGTGWSWSAADGNLYVSSCGVTFTDVKIAGNFVINDNVNNGTHSASTPCVTLKDSEVDGIVQVSNNDGTGNSGPLVMTDDTVAVPDGRDLGASPVLSANYFATRVKVTGGRLGLACQGTCSITDSYEDMGYLACSGNGTSTCNDSSGNPCTDACGYHYDGWGSNGIWWNMVSYNPPTSAGVTLEHDTWGCGFDNYNTAYGELAGEPSIGAGCTADIGINSDFGPPNNITIDKNLILSEASSSDPATGRSLINHCMQLSNINDGKYFPYASNERVTNNVIQKGGPPQAPNHWCADSPSANESVIASWTYGDGNVWSGNTWDDGTPLNLTAGPTNTTLPVITGTPGNGNTLSVTTGTWTNCGTGCTYTYRWFDCGTGSTVNCMQINAPESGGGHNGERNSTYTMQAGDVPTYAAGYQIKAVVIGCIPGSTAEAGCTYADAAAVR